MTRIERAGVAAGSEWHDALGADDVEEEDVRPATAGGLEIAIYKVKGQFFATEDRCTHGEAALSEGVVIGDVIECPLHQGRFCIRTGRPKGGPVIAPLRTFETRVEAGRVLVRIPVDAATPP